MYAMHLKGARYLHIHVPCPLGWGSAPEDTIRVARLAVESGLFPLIEAENGELTGRYKLRRRVPVTDYLKLQKRFAHLLRPENRPLVDEIQHRIDEDWDALVARCT